MPRRHCRTLKKGEFTPRPTDPEVRAPGSWPGHEPRWRWVSPRTRSVMSERVVPPDMSVVPPPTRSVEEQEEHLESDSAKLLRITEMAYELLEEVRRMRLDEGGRPRLRAIHEATFA